MSGSWADLNVASPPLSDLRLAGQADLMDDKQANLQIGDRVRLSGGYDMEPAWLSGMPFIQGTVMGFIPGQNDRPAAVITLDAPITAEGKSGDTLVLKLRYAGAEWASTETVHVELCDFPPEPKRWQDRRQGKWVESHATYRLINGR